MDTPTQSYRIWFSQRSGSTLLCKALEDTGLAGKPGELLVLMGEKSLLQKHEARNYAELKETIWQSGMGQNGVFGVKEPLHWERYERNFKEICQLQGIVPPADHESVWRDLFPNCQHIYLTRRNKVRQVVSWWKAIQDNVWHLNKGQSHQNEESFYEEKYNAEALTHLFKESVLMECAVQQYFDLHHIVPHTIVYEDFIKNYEGTVRAVLQYLNLKAEGLSIKKPFYKPTADSFSERWVARFRKDLQLGFQEITY